MRTSRLIIFILIIHSVSFGQSGHSYDHDGHLTITWSSPGFGDPAAYYEWSYNINGQTGALTGTTQAGDPLRDTSVILDQIGDWAVFSVRVFSIYGDSSEWVISDTVVYYDDSPCDCVPGDANDEPPINILDIVYLINYKYKDGPAPVPFVLCSGDANCDCVVNILDIVDILNYKYKEGPEPCSCEEFQSSCVRGLL
jgi:hypothetical protein